MNITNNNPITTFQKAAYIDNAYSSIGLNRANWSNRSVLYSFSVQTIFRSRSREVDFDLQYSVASILSQRCDMIDLREEISEGTKSPESLVPIINELYGKIIEFNVKKTKPFLTSNPITITKS